MTGGEVILDVRRLRRQFQLRGGMTIQAVDGVSFQLHAGEIFGLVGESGCGKSTLARTLTGIYAPTSGEIFFKGQRVFDAGRNTLCRDMQIVFQDADAALNPRMTVGESIAESLLLRGMRGTDARRRVSRLLSEVGLDDGYRHRYPDEISGGQRQRVCIARVIGAEPALIVADEPIASLDVSMQAQIVNLFLDLQEKNRFSLIFISHDLSMVRFISDRIGVMYRGKLVEIAEAETLFADPLHPYTRSLLSSVPLPDPRREKRRETRVFDAAAPMPDGVLHEASPGHYVMR